MYCFIDGAYARKMLEDYTAKWFKEPTADFWASAMSAGCDKTFYYDAPPPQKEGETPDNYGARLQATDAYLNSLRMNPGWHVFEGVTKKKGTKATQKEVDILIAVDMLTHTHRKNTDRIRFIAGDLDFRPLIESVVRDGMYLELWYEPGHAAPGLIHAADAKHPLDVFAMHGLLKPEYRQRHPLPQNAHGEREPNVNSGVLRARGYDGTGNHIAHLWESEPEDRWYITTVVPLVGTYHPMMYIERKHHDRLLQVWELKYGALEWRPT